MVTTKEKLIEMLIQHGLFKSQAEEIMKLSIPEIESMNPSYKITWDRDAEEYPNSIYNLWFMLMKPIVLKWIDKNKPQAFFRPLFI